MLFNSYFTLSVGHKNVVGDVHRFGLDRGVPLEPQNPYPSLRVILVEKSTHCYGFFLKNSHKFLIFGVFCHAKTQKFGLSQKIGPMFKDFFVKNGTHA